MRARILTIVSGVVRGRWCVLLSVLVLLGSLSAAVATGRTAPARHYEPLSIRAKRLPATGVATPVMDGGRALTPSDLKAAYAIPDSTVSTTVAVVDAFGDSAVESNLATYRSTFGLPACTRATGCLTVVNGTGGTNLPRDDDGWAAETDLDVQMISAVCPSCHILLVEAADDGAGLDSAVAYAATHADYVSLSWGAPESSDYPNDVIPELATPGKVFSVAAGDEGYGGDSPGYPATDPNVVAVGGTSLTYAGGRWTDSVWNELEVDGGATGSGCSRHEAQPVWQSSVAAITAVCGKRLDNDLAIVGDPETGVANYTDGTWYLAGGTSAGAPMIAALYAIADKGMRPSSTVGAAQVAYQHPDAFRDVSSGADGYCSSTLICTAGTGYDGPSGLGVPDGVAGLSAPGTVPATQPQSPNRPPAPPRTSAVAYSRSASTITYGRSVTFGGAVTDLASHARLTGVSVQLQARAASGWRTIRTVRASGSGTVRAALKPTRGTTYRWYLPASSAAGVRHAAAASAAFGVKVKIAKGRTRLVGKVRAGHRLRVTMSGWGPHGVRYRFAWYVGSKRLAAGGRGLTLRKAWRGKRITVRVTARAAGLQTVSTQIRTRSVRN